MTGSTCGHRPERSVRLIALWTILLLVVVNCRASWPGVSPSVPMIATFPSVPTETPTAVVETSVPSGSPVEATPVPVLTPAREAPTKALPSSFVAATCCGLFAWAGPDWLLVYDQVPRLGAWLVNVVSGERRWIASRFGTPGGGLIAVPDPIAQRTEIFDWNGRQLQEVDNGGSWTSLDPTGRWLVWLRRRPEKVPSSAVSPVSEIWLLDRVSGALQHVGSLRVTSLMWLGDGSGLALLATTDDDLQTGLWVVRPPWERLELVWAGRFFSHLEVLPEQAGIIVTRVLSGDAGLDGVWYIDLKRGTKKRLELSSRYRTTRDAIIELQYASARDRLVRWDVLGGQLECVSELQWHVQADRWDVSPDGAWVAYWAAETQQVVVERLPSCSSVTDSRHSSPW